MYTLYKPSIVGNYKLIVMDYCRATFGKSFLDCLRENLSHSATDPTTPIYTIYNIMAKTISANQVFPGVNQKFGIYMYWTRMWLPRLANHYRCRPVVKKKWRRPYWIGWTILGTAGILDDLIWDDGHLGWPHFGPIKLKEWNLKNEVFFIKRGMRGGLNSW